MGDEPNGRIQVEDCAKRVRGYLGGVVVVDTIRSKLVWEIPHYPAYYFPADDVRMDLLTPTGAVVPSPRLGQAELFTITTDAAMTVNGAWRYANSPAPELRGLIRIDWQALDAWFEEDEEVYVHPRSPHSRVDIMASSRHVRVELDGVTVAETRRPTLLFETGLPTRYYLPLPDVRMELLRPSKKVTQCPYKGTATYWSVAVGDDVWTDIVWTYKTPLPESQKVAGLACFYNEHVDLFVDDVRQERPTTPFS